MMGKSYHIPVLRKEIGDLLITNIDGVYVDGTLGGGGHAEYLLKKLSSRAQYIALDLDKEAIEFAQARLGDHENITFYQANFKDIDQVFMVLGIKQIDGLLLDLGVSSHQIDEPERGFSYMMDGNLDMRMNTEGLHSAADLLNSSSVDELSDIFFHFGEEKNAKKIARIIVEERLKTPIVKTEHLRAIISRVSHPRFVIKSYARVFQAIRIAVNHELENLQTALTLSLQIIRSGGRIAVIAYHSLEDRMVKRFFREKANPCTCPPDFPQCVCGREPEIKIITKKPVKPAIEETNENTRARSALLRVGEVL